MRPGCQSMSVSIINEGGHATGGSLLDNVLRGIASCRHTWLTSAPQDVLILGTGAFALEAMEAAHRGEARNITLVGRNRDRSPLAGPTAKRPMQLAC